MADRDRDPKQLNDGPGAAELLGCHFETIRDLDLMSSRGGV